MKKKRFTEEQIAFALRLDWMQWFVDNDGHTFGTCADTSSLIGLAWRINKSIPVRSTL